MLVKNKSQRDNLARTFRNENDWKYHIYLIKNVVSWRPIIIPHNPVIFIIQAHKNWVRYNDKHDELVEVPLLNQWNYKYTQPWRMFKNVKTASISFHIFLFCFFENWRFLYDGEFCCLRIKPSVRRFLMILLTFLTLY